MNRPTALIAEDEALMRQRLKDKLEQAWPELDIVAEVEDGNAALEAFAAHRPQLAFLDIRMPGKTGLDVAAAIGSECHIVFITAYDKYALQAFEAGAVDYLLKPVESDRLELAVDRMKRKLSTPPADLSALLDRMRQAIKIGPTRLKWITAAVGKQVKLIAVSEVQFFQSDTKYTRVVMGNGEALIRTPLKELLAELDPEKFWQIHRGTIINLDAVSGVIREDAEHQYVVLKGRQERLPISRQFTHLFKQM